MAKPILREMPAQRKFVSATGIHDRIAAVIAAEMNFDAVYGSDHRLTASAHDLPDAEDRRDHADDGPDGDACYQVARDGECWRARTGSAP